MNQRSHTNLSDDHVAIIAKNERTLKMRMSLTRLVSITTELLLRKLLTEEGFNAGLNVEGVSLLYLDRELVAQQGTRWLKTWQSRSQRTQKPSELH